MLTGSSDFVKAHLVLQRDQVEWLDRQARESALGRSAVARMLLREQMRSEKGTVHPVGVTQDLGTCPAKG